MDILNKSVPSSRTSERSLSRADQWVVSSGGLLERWSVAIMVTMIVIWILRSVI
jgi:hypothetical protein